MTITCLHPAYLIPVEPANQVLTSHALVMNDSLIEAILPSDEARLRYPDAIHQDLPNHALTPGFINLHGHSAMSLLRGLADDLALMDWLNHHIWPAEKAHVSDEFVFDGTSFAMAEMLRGGTTTINDMYFHHAAVARAGIASGMNTVVGCSILEFPTGYAQDAAGYLQLAEDAINEYRGQAGIGFTLAPHAPYTVADDTFRKVAAMAADKGVRIHCHIHETNDEVQGSISQYGKRPLARLAELGLLSEQLIAAHMVHTTDEDIALLAKHGVHIAHNPASNLKLASGFARIHAMQQAGINIGIGTDGAASNNKLDMMADTRLAAILAKAQSSDPTAVNAHTALRMATLDGAKALGSADRTGSLTAGKQADVIAIDLSAIETQPVFDPVSHVIYAAGREQVSHVWVRGKALLVNRELQTLDQQALLAKARWWQQRIRPQ